MTEMSLSKRERQMMDIVFRLKEASAADVQQQLPDAPGYTAVRTMLKLLEGKGLLQHRQEGKKYIYSPCKSPKSAGRSALSRVLEVFFSGSLEDAIAAHLNDPKMKLDAEDFERLRAVIDSADVVMKKPANRSKGAKPKSGTPRKSKKKKGRK